MEELIDELRTKQIKTKRETAIYSLFGELGVYSSDEITIDVRYDLVFRVYNFDRLIFLNMKIMSAALIILYFTKLNKLKLDKNTFDNLFDMKVKKYFISNNLESSYKFEDIKIDIFRYIRYILLNEN